MHSDGSSQDPEKVDVVAQPPKRRRRITKRKKSTARPSKEETSTTLERLRAKPCSPGILIEPQPDNSVQYEAPHTDTVAWDIQIHAAFGTRSTSTVQTFLEHLRGLVRTTYRDDVQQWVPDEIELNAILNIVHSTQPQNEMEAMLAAQMCAIHLMQIRSAGYALSTSSSWIEPKNAATVSMLSRTFVKQMEELRRQKNPDRPLIKQEITVIHRTEVHHYDHSQHVHLEGGASHFGGQVHGREGKQSTAAIQGRAALPGSCEVNGATVPITSGEGKACVPDSWRRSGNGSAAR